MQTPAVPARAHDRHGPGQALAQHTPCAQMPLAHSLLFRQGAPPPARRHTPFWHTPIVQSGSAVQEEAQELPPLLHL